MMPDMSHYMARDGRASGTTSSPDLDRNLNYAMAVGGPESSMMDSNGPYSPKQHGLMSALEIAHPPGADKARQLE